MADELTVNLSWSYTMDGSTTASTVLNSTKFTITGDEMVKGKFLVPTSKAAIPLGPLDSVGFVIGKNLDATNYIEIFPDGTGLSTIKVGAGEPFVFRAGASAQAPQWQANTATVKVELAMFEN